MSFIEFEQHQDIAIIWLNQSDSKVNTISPEMIAECAININSFLNNDTIKAGVLISRKKDFVAGADVKNILNTTEHGVWKAISRKGHELLHKIENSEKPIVAAINGAALGGGLEIALACHYRIASNNKNTVFALPEVRLGLLPAGGGTQRLTELIGIRHSLDIMLTGKNIYAHKAQKMGFIDSLANPEALLNAAIEQAKKLIGKDFIRANKQNTLDKLIDKAPLIKNVVFSKARKKVIQSTYGNYPAPLKIIECVEIGKKYGRKAGFEAEIEYFDELVTHPVTKQLIRIFFNMTDKKNNPFEEKTVPINQVAILGAGFMGIGISDVCVNNNIPIILKDINPQNLSNAKQQIYKGLSEKVNKKIIRLFDAQQTINKIQTQTSYHNFNSVNMVIEAVFEDISLKQKVLAECESVTPNNCIFATNTSALPVKMIAQYAQRPQNVIGMHYFSPVPKMPLLEIIVTDKTADWVIASTLDVGIKQGKTCIVVKDGPGFYTTRILAPFLNEALLILEEGGSILQIDECAKQLGFPVGPITLIDEVGIDVGAHIMSGNLIQFFKQRNPNAFKISTAIIDLNKAGYQGKKNNKGFYSYDSKTGKKNKNKVDPEIYDFFGGTERTIFKNKQIRHRLILSMINEAAQCLQDGIILSPSDGDIGAIFGLGFPPFTGGPFRYLDTIGCDNALRRFDKLSEKNGERFAPAQLIVDYAKNKAKFYQ